ncbi:hypothetical protein BGZ74_010158, partial [Mortierella antarctica]
PKKLLETLVDHGPCNLPNPVERRLARGWSGEAAFSTTPSACPIRPSSNPYRSNSPGRGIPQR